jgi:hypothetical protein
LPEINALKFLFSPDHGQATKTPAKYHRAVSMATGFRFSLHLVGPVIVPVGNARRCAVFRNTPEPWRNTMNKIIASLAVIAFVAPAYAQDVTPFAELDVDANGELSFEELTVALPELSVEQFATIDTDANGSVSEEEYLTYNAAMGE